MRLNPSITLCNPPSHSQQPVPQGVSATNSSIPLYARDADPQVVGQSCHVAQVVVVGAPIRREYIHGRRRIRNHHAVSSEHSTFDVQRSTSNLRSPSPCRGTCRRQSHSCRRRMTATIARRHGKRCVYLNRSYIVRKTTGEKVEF